jgi:hypothetical protein
LPRRRSGVARPISFHKKAGVFSKRKSTGAIPGSESFRPGVRQKNQINKTMKIEQIAQGLVKFCRKANFNAAIDAYYSDKIVSVEPAGDDRVTRGLAAVKSRGDWWVANHTVHKMTVEGPFVGKTQFVVRFICDITPKATKKRFVVDELGIYTVSRGKIVHVQYFYHVG